MARYPKCRYCKQDVEDKTQATKKGSAWIHNDCIEKEEQEKELNKTDRQKILDYVNDLFENPNFPMITKQLKELTERKGMKESGILLTLKYIYEIEGMRVLEDRGIGLVEYKYEEAKKYHINKCKIAKEVKDFDVTGETIVMKKGKDIDLGNKYKEIDMDSL